MFKRYLTPLVCLVLALSLFIGDSADRLSKAQWLSQTIFLPFSKSLITVSTINNLKKDNKKLQQQLALKTLEVLSLKNQIRAYQNYQSFRLDLQGIPFVMAEVVGYSGLFQDRTLIVNVGLKDGIEIESPVVSAEGIIGKVISVSVNNAVVLPLNHTQFQLAVMDLNTNVQGILQSDITGKIAMNLIKLGSQISIGDTIVTSNLSRIFPKGYPVGKICRIKESTDNLFLSAEIKPFTLIENIEHVFILKKSFIYEQMKPISQTEKQDSVR